mgnify:CR=1 FL=1
MSFKLSLNHNLYSQIESYYIWCAHIFLSKWRLPKQVPEHKEQWMILWHSMKLYIGYRQSIINRVTIALVKPYKNFILGWFIGHHDIFMRFICRCEQELTTTFIYRQVNVVDGLAGRIHKLMFKGILESIQRLVLNFKPQICMCIHLLQSTWAKALFGLFLCYDCTLMLIVYPWVLVLGPPLLVTAINETHW